MAKMYKIYDSTRDALNSVVTRLAEGLDVGCEAGLLTDEEIKTARHDVRVGTHLMTALRGATTDGFTLKRAKDLIKKYESRNPALA